GITVKLVNQGSASDLQSKLTASAASQTLPDLSMAYNNYFTEYVAEVIPLDDFVADDFDDFEDILESYRNENSEYGFMTGLPFNKSTYLYFYNKTLFDEVGITAPETWDDFYTAGEAMMEAKGLAIIGFDDLAGMVESFMYQAGTEYASEEGVLFNNEEGLAAAQLIVDLYSAGYAKRADDGEYFSTMLSNGLIAGYVGSSAGVSYITADGWELGVAPLAGGPAGKSAYMAGTNMIMFTTDENKQLAAWEYMKYMTSTDVTVEWSMNTGYLPVRSSAYETEEYQAYMEENAAAAAAYEQKDDMFFTATFSGSSDLRTAMNTTADEIILLFNNKSTDDDVDAQGALDMLVEAAETALA
ncbi:MAG: extracellular solute-binding protein, partial [Lachnospiraceae bacterium]|nr:extracellular solute-binding protein [Lachnospiraceae bacterium]